MIRLKCSRLRVPAGKRSPGDARLQSSLEHHILGGSSATTSEMAPVSVNVSFSPALGAKGI